jgi:hypothetical protein
LAVAGKAKVKAIVEAYPSETSWAEFYLITLSARASTFGGIVRPICSNGFGKVGQLRFGLTQENPI